MGKILHVGEALRDLLLLTHFKPNDIPLINANSLVLPLSIISNDCGKIESKPITQKKKKRKKERKKERTSH
jgi:hypothetical protein